MEGKNTLDCYSLDQDSWAKDLVAFIKKNSSLRAEVTKGLGEPKVKIHFGDESIFLISNLIWRGEGRRCYLQRFSPRRGLTLESFGFGIISLSETDNCCTIELCEHSSFQDLGTGTSSMIKRLSITKKEIAEGWLIDE